MPDNSDLNKKLAELKKNPGMSVPEGYFEYLPAKVMSKIKEEENTTNEKSIIKLLRPQLALIASFAAIFIVAYTGFRLLIPENNSSNLNKEEIMAVLKNEIQEIDETQLYNLTFEDETNTQHSHSDDELSRDEIINYLIEEGEDIDLLINGY